LWGGGRKSWERRLNNTISFKNVISETQKSLVKDSRSKRCPEVSLSVARSSANVAAVESRRRSFAFILTLSMCPPRVMKLDLLHLYPHRSLRAPFPSLETSCKPLRRRETFTHANRSKSIVYEYHLPIYSTAFNKYSHPYTYVSNPHLNPKCAIQL
jgi:hypothetical protein